MYSTSEDHASIQAPNSQSNLTQDTVFEDDQPQSGNSSFDGGIATYKQIAKRSV